MLEQSRPPLDVTSVVLHLQQDDLLAVPLSDKIWLIDVHKETSED